MGKPERINLLEACSEINQSILDPPKQMQDITFAVATLELVCAEMVDITILC